MDKEQSAVKPEEIAVHLTYIRRDITKINEKLDIISSNYVQTQEYVHFKDFVENTFSTKDELDPVRKLVYGGVSLILMVVVGAIVTLVIQQ